MQKFSFSLSYMEFLSKNYDNEKTKNVQRYARFHERQSVLKFENKSMSINEYNDLEKSFTDIEQVYGSEYSTNAIDLAISQGIDLIVPSAHANPMSFWTKTAGLSVAAIGILVGWMASNWVFYDNFLAAPGRRAIAFGLMSALAFSTSEVVTPKIIAKMDSNINKVNAILAQMKISSGQANKVNNTAIGGPKNNAPINRAGQRVASSAVTVSDDPNEKFPCVAPGENGKCSKISNIMDSKLSEMQGVDLGGMSQFSSNLAKFGDGVSGQNKVSGATMDTAATLAQGALGMRKIQEDNEKKLNDARKQAGLAPIDFKKDRDDLFKRLFNSTKSQFGKTTDKGALASLMGNLDQGAKTDEKAKGNGHNAAAFKMPTFTMPSMPSMNPGQYKSAQEDAPAQVAVEEKKADGLEAYEDSSAQIVKSPEVSIFQVISTRYWKTGFDKLLERETVKPPLLKE